MGSDMKAAIKKESKGSTKYKSETAAGLYPTTGSTDDWMSENAKMWGHGWTVELPDSDKGGHGFLLPASQILPASKEIYQGLLSFVDNLADAHKQREKLGVKEWTAQLHQESAKLLKEDLGEGNQMEHLDELNRELEAQALDEA